MAEDWKEGDRMKRNPHLHSSQRRRQAVTHTSWATEKINGAWGAGFRSRVRLLEKASRRRCRSLAVPWPLLSTWETVLSPSAWVPFCLVFPPPFEKHVLHFRFQVGLDRYTALANQIAYSLEHSEREGCSGSILLGNSICFLPWTPRPQLGRKVAVSASRLGESECPPELISDTEPCPLTP